MIRAALMALVRGYRFFLSPWLGSSCRFTPTCSAYSLEALQRHGAGAGTYLTAARLLRCHPWCAGGHDPVPRVFSWHIQRERALQRAPENPPSSHSQ